MAFLVGLFFVVIATVSLAYFYIRWLYGFWERKKVPYVPATFPFGTKICPDVPICYIFKVLYDHFKEQGLRYGGFYGMLGPVLLWVDLELVKNVLMKDFQHFVDRGIHMNAKTDPLSAHLFNLEGKQWKNMRVKLTPTFTSGKMKMMFQILVDCSANLVEKVRQLADDKEPIDIKDVLGCFTTDVIGSCAFGLECNSFDEKSAAFRHFGRRFFEKQPRNILPRIIASAFPKAARFFDIRYTEEQVQEFFLHAVKETVEHRVKNNIKRNDFLQLLIDMMEGEEPLNLLEVSAQSFLFFVAGFETSSTTMTFALYELSQNPELQQKLREEINEALKKHDGKIDYEWVHNLKYLGQVLSETLRKYPPVPALHRQCTKDYAIPDSDLVLEKGTNTFVPVLGIHRDPDYYPEPLKFDPERFSDEEKHKIPQFAYIPFGDGPRNCIGLRFGLMQSRVGLVRLLSNYEFSVDDKTIRPLRYEHYSFIMSTHGGMWLRAKKIENKM